MAATAGAPTVVVPYPLVKPRHAGVPSRPATRREAGGFEAGAPLRRDALFRRLLAFVDALALVAALALLDLAAHSGAVKPAAAALVLVAVVLAKVLGLYDRDELVFHKSTLDEAPKLFQLSALLVLCVWFAHPELVGRSLGRGALLLFWAAQLGGTFALRLAARRVARAMTTPERCLVVGGSDARSRFAGKLAQTHSGIEVVGYLPIEDERSAERRLRVRWQGQDRRRRALGMSDLDEVIADLQVHRVVIIPGAGDTHHLLESVGRAKALGVKVSIVPRLFEVVGSSVEFDDLEGMTVLGVRRFGLSRSSRALKRATDVVVAAVGLVLLAPLLAIVAALVRIDSRGPSFFRQERVGRDGRVFSMVKFRTMFNGAHQRREEFAELNESDGLFKITDDPRVTRVGRLLRATHADELPQLVNVLRGEMSLVGPRPLVADEDARVAGHRRGRSRLVPGMTGPWQLLGPTRVSLEEMATIDYLYGANWSLWNDVKILARTARHVLRRRGL